MCGIFGFVGPQYSGSKADLTAMKNSLNHRGPDSFDFFTVADGACEINLGHVRLAIIDTSNAGSQPMHSKSGRYVIVFNGEIYNFLAIKQEINEASPGITWTGTSDTEVLLEGIDLFGLTGCVSKLVGMFAMVIWDKQLKKIILVRDRIGEKPLYYGYQDDQLVFASELKAFEKHSKFERKINYDAAVGFLLRSCVPQSLSIYENVYKVTPGSILEISLDDIKAKSAPAETIYWSLTDMVKQSKSNGFTGTYEQAMEQLEQLLITSVKCQSISDVPLGAFLSGGIDSSIVCAIYKAHVNSNLHTFTIGMPEPGINEALHAGKVAESIGTIHKSKYLDTAEIIARMDEIIGYWDEPFADSSQIPTFFVSELARKEITVSLSGDGADEFIYGYADHPIYKKFGKFKLISLFRPDKWINRIPFLKNNPTFQRIANFSYLLWLINKSRNLNELHARWRNKFRNTALPVRSAFLNKQDRFLNLPDKGFDFAGYYDALAYLPDDILVKVDRAAMAVSLESRAPFLDHRIIEFLIKLPDDFKYQNNISKRILKDILYKYVPKEIVDRPKQGFSIPLTHWLRNEIKDWAFATIDHISENSGFWDKKLVVKLWNEHQNGENDHAEKLWNIIVLEKFFQRKLV